MTTRTTFRHPPAQSPMLLGRAPRIINATGVPMPAGPRRGPSEADPHPRRRPSSAAPGVHLTRRGRALLVALLMAVVFGAFSLGRAASEAVPVAGTTPVLEQVTVAPGESLWTVARRIAPDNDPREVIAQIRRLNDLADAQVRAGQLLLLPTSAA